MPALAAEGILVGAVDDLTEEELRELELALRARDLPGADAARRRARAAVPVHLAACRSASASSSATRSPGEERFARVKVPEGLPRFAPVGERGMLLPLESVIGTLPALALPGHGDPRARRRSGSPATPTSSSRTRPTTCSRPSRPSCEAPFRRSRPARGLASMSRAMLDAARAGAAGPPTSRSIRSTGMLDLARRAAARTRLDRPDLKDEPWVPITQRRLLSPKTTTCSPRSAAARPRSSSTRTTRSRRASRRSCDGGATTQT